MSRPMWRTRCDAYLNAHDGPAVSLEQMLQRIPKVDLHCHLNGSISHALLAHLEKLKQGTQDSCAGASSPSSEEQYVIPEAEKVITREEEKEGRSPAARMHACFATFDKIYGLMDNLAFTRLAVQDLLFCSAAECIVVLEIRTSLRDGLRASFTAPQDDKSNSTQVSKEDYLRTVCTTAEHLLTGGVVDFRTGALIRLHHSTQHGNSGACETTWWADFARVYRFLLPFLRQTDITASLPSTQRLLAQLQHHLQQGMHVRLLVSINRGQSEAAALEAVRLARALQRAQVRTFHMWCTRKYAEVMQAAAAEEEEGTSASHTALWDEVCRHLRQTCWLTGMDFSGNCYKHSFADFVPALRAARHAYDESASLAHESTGANDELPCTLAITVHGAEKVDEEELREMCDFGPDRWGHLVFAQDALREAILRSYAPIELCITSNLITCGHVGPRQHHIGPLMQQWWSLTETYHRSTSQPPRAAPVTLVRVLCNDDDDEDEEDGGTAGKGSEVTREGSTSVYVCTEQLRRARRLRRWQGASEAFCMKSRQERRHVLPNVSFHTDDRGVFASTLSHELALLAQHPCFSTKEEGEQEGTSNETSCTHADCTERRDVLRTMWALQRLALLQVFELPWPALLLAHWLCKAVHEKDKDMESMGIVLVGPAAGLLASWADFVTYCRTLCPASQQTSRSANEHLLLFEQLSVWEWRWLTRGFDAYE